MGRGSRSDASTVTLRETAITVAEDAEQPLTEPRQIGIWRMEPLPERDTLRAADASAPRDAHANLAKHARHAWSEDRGLADHQRAVAVVFCLLDGMGGYQGAANALRRRRSGRSRSTWTRCPNPLTWQVVNAGWLTRTGSRPR